MTEADLERARVQILSELIPWTGSPYRWGMSACGIGVDCSNLVRAGLNAAGVWPQKALDAYLSVHPASGMANAIWHVFDAVEWNARQPGDVVCFGEHDYAHHVAVVLTLPTRAASGSLIGANHGRAPMDGESSADYAKAMNKIPARVEIVSDLYWSSRRMGVVRAPLLKTVS